MGEKFHHEKTKSCLTIIYRIDRCCQHTHSLHTIPNGWAVPWLSKSPKHCQRIQFQHIPTIDTIWYSSFIRIIWLSNKTGDFLVASPSGFSQRLYWTAPESTEPASRRCFKASISFFNCWICCKASWSDFSASSLTCQTKVSPSIKAYHWPIKLQSPLSSFDHNRVSLP